MAGGFSQQIFAPQILEVPWVKVIFLRPQNAICKGCVFRKVGTKPEKVNLQESWGAWKPSPCTGSNRRATKNIAQGSKKDGATGVLDIHQRATESKSVSGRHGNHGAGFLSSKSRDGG